MTPLHQMLDDLFEGLGWFVGLIWGCLAVGIMAIAFGTALPGLRPEPASSLGHSAGIDYRKGEPR